MSKHKSPKTAAELTAPRTFRLDAALMKRFEDDCDRHLRRPSMVVEALIHHWLTSDAKSKVAIADSFHAAESRKSKE